MGFTHRVNDQWQIMAEVTRTAWSKFDQVVVDYDSNQPDSVLPFHYRDTTFASIGTDFRVNDKLTCAAAWPMTRPRPPMPTATCACRTPPASGCRWA